MKDINFDEFKNFKPKQLENKMNITNNKYSRNARSRMRSMEKTSFDDKLDQVNKKFSRAQSTSFGFFQMNCKISKKESDKFVRITDIKNTLGKSFVKKKQKLWAFL